MNPEPGPSRPRGAVPLGPRVRGQRGESLLESLLAIVILSMIAAATYAGLQVAMSASVQQSESAVANGILRNAAELLQDPDSDYLDRAGCEGSEIYGDLPSEPGYGEVDVTVRFVEPPRGDGGWALRVGSSDGDNVNDEAEGQGECPEVDPGLQAIDLSVTTPSGRVEHLEIVKRRQ